MLELRVELFGGFRLLIDRIPAPGLGSQGLQSLLAYLVLHREQPQPRQQIAFLLYPDSSDAQAQTNLRTLLTRLRRACPEADQFLHSESGTLGWNPDVKCSFDVAEFEGAITDAQANSAHGATARVALEKAIGLYRGDVLPSCYEDWILPERERLRQLFLHALEHLISLLQVHHETGLALVHAQHLLQLDPLQETTYQLLMRLHAAHGDRVSVIRAFQTCQSVLQRELGVPPSPETQKLVDTLQQTIPTLAPSLPLQPTSNLPVPLTSFVGRTRELAEVKQSLSATRLLTITGAGGSGKSRLALRLARDLVGEFPDGAWWAELAPLSDPALIPHAVALALGIPEQPGRALLDTVLDALQARQMLLILDNCEHLGAACAQFASSLLRKAAGVKILATSRESLGLLGESIYVVPPLAVPGEMDAADWQAIAESDAGRLLIERAQAVLPTFTLTRQNGPYVLEICRRLDGIPLAIELAAARAKSLSVQQIAARLDDRFSLLTSGNRAALPRHQTLRALVDWSYALLNTNERAFLQTLSVFAGGLTLEAAESVFDGSGTFDLLSLLIDKSMVRVDTGRWSETARYLLLETIRQYGLEKLREEGREAPVRLRHLAFFRSMAVQAQVKLRGREQVEWLNRLETERDNLRAALDWAIEAGQTEAALDLVGNWARFWYIRSEFIEGRRWLERVLALPDAEQYPGARMRALFFQGNLAWLQKGGVEAQPYFEECLGLARAHGDKEMMAHALDFLGLVCDESGHLAQAEADLQAGRALFQELGDRWGFAQSLWHLGWVKQHGGDDVQGLSLLQEAADIYQELGDAHRSSVILRSIAFAILVRGELDRACRMQQKALALARQVGSQFELANNLMALSENPVLEPGRRVSLLTAAMRLQRMIGALKASDEDRRQEMLSLLGAQMHEAALRAAVERGNRMTVEEAIGYALDPG